MQAEPEEHRPSNEAIRIALVLYSDLNQCFSYAVEMFETRWTKWLTLCEGQVASNGDVDFLETTAEYLSLERLGPKIVPMIVAKLAVDARHNCPGVYIYNALESDDDYKISIGEPPYSRNSLERLAHQVVTTNYERHKIYEQRVEAWKSHCDENFFRSSVAARTVCNEYEYLLVMGPSIISRLMVEFYGDQRGYWWELLHEIIHGRKTGTYMFQKRVLYHACSVWFDEGEHKQAPLYIQSDFDLMMDGKITHAEYGARQKWR